MGSTTALDEFGRRYAAAWCSQDPDQVAAHFSEAGWLRVNANDAAVGRPAIAEVARGFMTAFPDMHVAFDEVVAQPEGTVFRWTLTGTNTGPGGTGHRVCISGYEVWQLDGNGLIAESQGRFDAVDYERQLQYGVGV